MGNSGRNKKSFPQIGWASIPEDLFLLIFLKIDPPNNIRVIKNKTYIISRQEYHQFVNYKLICKSWHYALYREFRRQWVTNQEFSLNRRNLRPHLLPKHMRLTTRGIK